MMEDPVDTSRWVVIYPVYINSTKTVAQGRRISKAAAVDNPTIEEIGDCCNYLKIPYKLELDKAYSRDYMQRGRARVQLKTEAGDLSNPLLPSRKVLMLKVADLVKRHQGRDKKHDQAAGSSRAAASSGKGRRDKKKK